MPIGGVLLLLAVVLFFILRKLPIPPEANFTVVEEDDSKDKALLAGEKLYAMNASYE